MDYSALRKTYTDELTNFYQNGAFPEKTSADLRFGMDCQRQRLGKLGLTMTKKFDKTGAENAHSKEFIKSPYTYTVTSSRCNYETDFYKDGQFLSRSDVNEETLYMGILNKQEDAQARYTCRNCGHNDFLARFTSGCPMCGTTYEMQQTYPCVSGYYTRPTVLSKAAYKGMMKFQSWYCTVVGVFFGLLAGLAIADDNNYSAGEALGMCIFMIILFAGGLTLFGLLVSHVFLGPALAAKKAVQNNQLKDVKAAAETQTRMEAELKQYIPDFSYEYFEEKTMSLLRGIVFSDDREQLTIYDGQDDLRFMNDIVDVEYRGAIEYVGHTVDQGILRVNVKALVVCAYYLQGTVSFHKQTFAMTLSKRIKEEDYGFSIHAVNCKSCGGSFDAIHVSTCPYCGVQYSLVEDHWVVNQITFATM